MSPRNWTLNSYTNNTWTSLAEAEAVIESLIVANTGASAATVSMRISNGPTQERAIILPWLEVLAGSSTVIDLKQLNLGRADHLQVKATAAGVHFTASGEIS